MEKEETQPSKNQRSTPSSSSCSDVFSQLCFASEGFDAEKVIFLFSPLLFLLFLFFPLFLVPFLFSFIFSHSILQRRDLHSVISDNGGCILDELSSKFLKPEFVVCRRTPRKHTQATAVSPLWVEWCIKVTFILLNIILYSSPSDFSYYFCTYSSIYIFIMQDAKLYDPQSNPIFSPLPFATPYPSMSSVRIFFYGFDDTDVTALITLSELLGCSCAGYLTLSRYSPLLLSLLSPPSIHLSVPFPFTPPFPSPSLLWFWINVFVS